MGSDNSPKRPNAPPTDPDDYLFDGEEMGEPPGEIPGEFITMEEILDEDELLERIGGASDSEEEAPVPLDTEEGGDYEPARDDAVFTFREHSGPVFCGSFHPTEPLVVTGSEDDTAYVWRIPSGEVIFKAEGHTDTIIAASFSYDGNFLATGDLGGFLQVFRVSENYRRVWNFGIGDMAWMEWHRASNVLMAGSESGEVYFWRIPSGDCKVIQGHSAKAECASLTADAKKIVVGYGDGAVKLWDIKTAAIVQEIPANSALGHTDGVLCVATDPEGSLFVSGGSDGRLVISSAAGPLGRVEAGDSVEAVAFSPIAEALKLVATGTLDGKITVWDVARQSPRCQCRDDELTGVTKLFWTRDMTLYAATLDGSVRVFEGRSGGLKATLLGHKKEVYDVQLDKSGEFLLTTSEDGTAKIFRAVS